MATRTETFLTPDIPKNRSFPSNTSQSTVQRHPKFLTNPSKRCCVHSSKHAYVFSPIFTQMAFTQFTLLEITYLVPRHFYHPQRKHHTH